MHSRQPAEPPPPPSPRLDAVDIARGLAMLLVVAMHSILGVEAAMGQAGWLHRLVTFAEAFRVPAFFLISGLFLRRAMQLGWLDLFRKRIFGLIVLYLIWLGIHLTVRSLGGIIANPVEGLFGQSGLFAQYVLALIEPYGLLWFIHLMIAFLIVGRIAFMVPRLMPVFLVIAALLETARIETGSTLIDSFSARGFYFLLGLWLAPYVLPGGRKGPREGVKPTEPEWLASLRRKPGLLLGLLAGWALVQAIAAYTGFDHLPILSLVAGVTGAAALLLFGLWLAEYHRSFPLTRFFLHVGQNSIVIYLVFTLPMGALRAALLASGFALPVDLVSLLVLGAAVAASLAVVRFSGNTPFARLFERPVLGSAEHSRPAR